jgi:3-phosphoshikimate 1-carboxyvinyltransferase
MKRIIIHPAAHLSGTISIPGDKSISHRALMFASLALGESKIENLLLGHDCLATLAVMRSLGAHIAFMDGVWSVHGRGKHGLVEPISILDCKNSGTTIRLMAGLLSAMPFMSILDGSDQIKTRPMDRVVRPLTDMGAKIYGRSQNRLAPLAILPSDLVYTSHKLVVKSAQVKSALILAGLFARGTEITGIAATRDHTEKLLSFMGADIESLEDIVRVKPLSGELRPIIASIPGDISSAAFLIVAGVLKARDTIVLKDVGINPTRVGIVDALKMMGANIVFANEKIVANEPVADIHIERSSLKGATFSGNHIVRMIDEIPILALAATQAQGTTVIRDASELRVKESNRITRTVQSLQKLGARIDETDDGMIIHGQSTLQGAEVSSFGDHRIALFMSIAGLISHSPVTISNAAVTDDSFPGFLEALSHLGARVEEVL